MTRRIVIAGGSGFIGRLLGKSLVEGDFEVVVLTRSPDAAATPIHKVQWDGCTLGDWAGEIEGADALVNLAGRSVNCRYNERNRREIRESRIQSTRVVGEAISRCRHPPRVWLNASTATIYKHTFDQEMDEATGDGLRRRSRRSLPDPAIAHPLGTRRTHCWWAPIHFM